MTKTRAKVFAELGLIIGSISKLDRDCKRAEYTDLNDAWNTLYNVKNAARRALRAMNTITVRPERQHGRLCAQRFSGAAECTCGKSERDAREEAK